VLYHLQFPGKALQFMAERCREMLLLETCVGAGGEEAENPVSEPKEFPSQAVSGKGCRPSRAWVFSRLKALFPYVYVPITQPWHEQFPLDWSSDTAETTVSSTCYLRWDQGRLGQSKSS
jgi:hypothetical protein